MLLVPAIFLVGCGAQESYDTPSPSGDASFDGGYGDDHIVPEDDYYVKKFDIDGTTCVIYKDGKAGGLSCNWPVETMEPTDAPSY
jgi:hypothetical protein